MNEASQKESLSQEEKQRLIAFFSILIAIDKRKHITQTAKEKYKKKANHGAEI